MESLASDYLHQVLTGSEFHTFYPYQVHQALNDSEAHFRFVGSLPILRNYVKLGLDSAQKEFIADPTDTMMASQRQDLILMPFNRIDIWQKMGVEAAPSKGTLSDFYLGCVATTETFPSHASKGYLKLNFSDPVYSHLKNRLNQSFLTLDEIVQETQHLNRPPQEVVDRLMLLVMADQVRYCLRQPTQKPLSPQIHLKGFKVNFCHHDNQQMFSDVGRFCHELGVIIHPESGMVIPFDQKTSMVMAALTKVHESLAPQYCAEVWAEHTHEKGDIAEATKEFRSVYLFFKRHYVRKLIELGIIEINAQYTMMK